jgi:hypothetical protein
VPRSVTTLNALDCRSFASTKVAFTLLLSTESFERAVIEVGPITASSLTVDFTFSTCAIDFSTAARSASDGTSPVRSTTRL